MKHDERGSRPHVLDKERKKVHKRNTAERSLDNKNRNMCPYCGVIWRQALDDFGISLALWSYLETGSGWFR